MQNEHLEKAKALYSRALAEMKLAQQKNDLVGARDAAGKAWLATVEAINALFIKKGQKEEELPTGERGRTFLLGRYGTREIRRLYETLHSVFHIKAYYDEIIDFDRLFECFDFLKELFDSVENTQRI